MQRPRTMDAILREKENPDLRFASITLRRIAYGRGSMKLLLAFVRSCKTLGHKPEEIMHEMIRDHTSALVQQAHHAEHELERWKEEVEALHAVAAPK